MNYQGLMEITKIENIADDVYEMTLKGEGAKYISQPGQFINIKINESLQPYLRRPMSISDYDENTIVVTDTPQMVDNWQLAFREKEHLDEVIRTYQMRSKNGLIRLEKELERFNPNMVIAVRKIDKNGTVQELNSDSLSNGHIAVLLAVWASAKASIAHSSMKAPNEEKTESNLLTPFMITTVSAKQKMRWLW